MCNLPFQVLDWKELNQISLVSLTTTVFEWSNWYHLIYLVHNFMDYLEINQLQNDFAAYHTLCLASMVKDGSILGCWSPPSIEYDASSMFCQPTQALDEFMLQQCHQHFKRMHWALSVGGLMLINQPLLAGCWYWEVDIVALVTFPVFIGITSSCTSLHSITPQNGHGD